MGLQAEPFLDLGVEHVLLYISLKDILPEVRGITTHVTSTMRTQTSVFS